MTRDRCDCECGRTWAERRGALLLLVLLMLALFMGIGLFALTIATRSRAAARAFASAQAADVDMAMLSESLLDQALMKLVRGPSSPGSTNDVPESLLEDMYCGERDLNRNGKIQTDTVDDAAELDIDSGRLTNEGDGGNSLTRSDSLTGRLVSTGSTVGPFTDVTVDVYFENDKIDSNGLWIAAQDLNNNGMYDPRPGTSLSGSASPAVVFNGRVITFCPAAVASRNLIAGSVTAAANQPLNPISYRIMRAERLQDPSPPCYQCQYKFYVADLVNPSDRPVSIALPPQTTWDVVINGPAFRVDPCDTPAEPWMAGLAGADVDNDNDGSADGRWLSGVLPRIRRPDGRSLRCDVSFLVKDLDGRINVNAHGATRRSSVTGRPYQAYENGSPREYGLLRRTVPIGMGYGPAEIDASALFSTVPGFIPDGNSMLVRDQPGYWVNTRQDNWVDGRVAPVASTWDVILRGDVDASVSSYPTPDPAPWLQRRPTPVLGGLVGRYGTDRVPGAAGQDGLSQNQDIEVGVATYGLLTGKSNSPSDFKGRMQIATQRPTDGKGVATLLFYAPDSDADLADDPYEVRLDRDGPRTGPSTPSGDASTDSLYTFAELERVLRQFDSDAPQLPPRLAAALGPRLKEDRDEDGQLDPGENDLGSERDQSGKISKYKDDGEDKAAGSLPPNGILDDGEDKDSDGYLDLSIDVNASGFRDVPEDRNRDSILNRYWPKEGYNPDPAGYDDFKRVSWERDFTQTLRDLITTDSWDTPGLTGLAARRIENYLIANPQLAVATSGSFSPDCLSGLRFDINRPIPLSGYRLDPSAAQAYCRHLQQVLKAISKNSLDDQSAAQWAVNVLDFRDADSIMTAFQYAPGQYVFGTERPEVLMTETASWVTFSSGTQGQVFVMLHRPWNAIAERFDPATKQPSQPWMAEQIDVRLTRTQSSGSYLQEAADQNGNGVSQEPALDLELRCPDATPVWRMVIAPGTPAEKIVRFDDVKTPGPNEFWVQSNRTQVRKITALPANSYLCVGSGPPQQQITVSGSLYAIDSGTVGLFVATPGVSTVELQRVADPWSGYDSATNPYVAVDRMTLKTIDRTINPVTKLPAQGWQMTKRAWTDAKPQENFDSRPSPPQTLTNFWRSMARLIPPDPAPAGGPSDLPPALVPIDYSAPWLHWPNRPFISVGELMLVPRTAAADWLQQYQVPCTNPGPAGTEAERLIFDACHVYTRFAGNRITLTGASGTAALQLVGSQGIPFDQLSRWREPGRVNLYTGSSTVVRSLVAGRRDGLTFPPLPYPDSGQPGPKAPTMTPTATLLCAKPDGTVFTNTAPEYAIQQAGLVKSPDPVDYIPFNPSQNPAFYLSTAIRMPNVATTRSHVFAVWVTLRLTDADDPAKVTFRRLFAIVDRSIPVGFVHGMNLNVADTIVLQRYLD